MTRGGARYDKDGNLLTVKKKNPNKKVAYATKLRPDQVEFLQSLKNAAAWLERMIDKYMREED